MFCHLNVQHIIFLLESAREWIPKSSGSISLDQWMNRWPEFDIKSKNSCSITSSDGSRSNPSLLRDLFLLKERFRSKLSPNNDKKQSSNNVITLIDNRILFVITIISQFGDHDSAKFKHNKWQLKHNSMWF